MSKKRKYGNPMKEKAYRESLRKESSDKKRNFLGHMRGDIRPACNHMLKTYPYVICCGGRDFVKIHGCFEHELQDEYHWVVEQVYENIFGSPVKLTNSSHPSNKVCPQAEIMKTIEKSKKQHLNFAQFEGGQYDYMLIAYAPFASEMNSAA